MAETIKDKEKEQVVETLKFTPQKVQISVQGYGAEICCGSLTKEQHDFWADDENKDYLESHMFGYGDEPEDGIPEDAVICEDGQYFEVDDLYHDCVPFEGATVTIEDVATGEEIDEYDLSWDNNNQLLESIEKETGEYPDEEKVGLMVRGEDTDCAYDSMKNGHYAYICSQSNERGSYHTGEITLTRPYKRGDIQFTYSEINERDYVINGGCSYLGEHQEDIEMVGDSTGKGYDCFIEKNWEHPDNKA